MDLKNWWTRRKVARARARLGAGPWERAWPRLPLLAGLDAGESQRLGDLALLFLHDKTLEAAAGAQLDDFVRLTVALQACLPVLNLGLDWYRGWYAVILYPAEFVPQREWVDEDGVVWVSEEPMSGEAWEQGPVILSWADVEAGDVRDGFNVVIHELAHKLDMLDGSANGHPPLHAGMSEGAWKRAFGEAYRDLSRRVDRGQETPIDPYAAESPAEFFAVCSEAFFELPQLLRASYPDVYEQMVDFYRQDPARRLAGVAVQGTADRRQGRGP
jgi:Mlc titration factor MtfA (ptsG expression regulator)